MHEPIQPHASRAAPAWAETFTRLLDDLIRIPGTRIGIGLDSIIGMLLPGVGDALTGVGSVSLLLLALKRGVPSVVLGRMVLNIGLDALLGAVPVLGDAFDVVWKANRRNLELLKEYQADSRKKPGITDYALVGVGLLLALLAILLPLLLLALIAGQISSGRGAR